MARLARPPDDRARELVLSRYRGVRRYLPALLETITFLANDAGEPILAALNSPAPFAPPRAGVRA